MTQRDESTRNPTEELIKKIEAYIKNDMKTYVPFLHQAVARLKELEREKEAYREVAIDHYDTLENHTKYEDSPRLVDKHAQGIMKEKK